MKKGILYILLLVSFAVFAQEKDKTLPKANDEFFQKKFVEAEANYRISNSKFPNRTVAPFNLGNAIYKQNQAGEAKFAYAKALKNIKSRTQKHKAYHNLGNVFMKEKDYSNAVEAYKNALRNNPADDETRYNLALAKKMLKENPPKKDKNKDKKDKDKDKKDDKNKDKDKKDDKGDKDKDNKDNKGDKDKKDDKGDQNKDKNGDKPKDDGQPKPIPGGISKQRLENLLDAVNNEEKKIQDKVNAQKVKGKPVQSEKNW
ncbi:tetratricopeptide repeat protein [Flavobacterium cellulosilyticum]|uniref:Tetratricopeptide repeat protein n=1 Tax=Flavobacterium cellulosilyticum TaxID=2541731 RepID=A0A4R5CKQ7_9FLAO|nr:tetratricopeptide repeat protein [Flavobacterium cellulosilyticum]TDD99786.1 tetratricopeptide repeat protein [Flavobacterium cellulosilyticum]